MAFIGDFEVIRSLKYYGWDKNEYYISVERSKAFNSYSIVLEKRLNDFTNPRSFKTFLPRNAVRSLIDYLPKALELADRLNSSKVTKPPTQNIDKVDGFFEDCISAGSAAVQAAAGAIGGLLPTSEQLINAAGRSAVANVFGELGGVNFGRKSSTFGPTTASTASAVSVEKRKRPGRPIGSTKKARASGSDKWSTQDKESKVGNLAKAPPQLDRALVVANEDEYDSDDSATRLM